VWEAVKPRLEELVAEWVPRTSGKQPITAMLLHRQLKAEGYRVGRTLVNDYWRERRRQRSEVYVPLAHRPGEAQFESSEKTLDSLDRNNSTPSPLRHRRRVLSIARRLLRHASNTSSQARNK
jgi:hypothetical protein